MNVDEVKGLCIALFIVDTLVLGWIPYFFVNRGGSKHQRLRSIIISHFNSFAGGVFLGVCLLGIMVEGREVMDDYLENSDTDTETAVYECFIAAGFFLIAVAEKVAHQLFHKAAHKQAAKKRQTPLTLNGSKQPSDEVTYNESQGVRLEQVSTIDVSATQVSFASSSTQTSSSEEEEEDHLEGAVNAIAGQDLFGAFLLLCAFSFHTVFDGLAVGLKETTSDVWQMFAGIVAHKSLVSLCLGLQFFQAYKNKPIWAFFWIFLLSLVTPIGIGAGMAILNSSMDELNKDLSSGILQGIATGTFLYVTCYEIMLPDVIKKPGYLRLFLAVVGFSCILVMQTAIGEGDEDH